VKEDPPLAAPGVNDFALIDVCRTFVYTYFFQRKALSAIESCVAHAQNSALIKVCCMSLHLPACLYARRKSITQATLLFAESSKLYSSKTLFVMRRDLAKKDMPQRQWC